ncbi:helix-turn-helix transcriptional regulator [Achromobacter spanius]|uniref:helix-turn-helix domain-containing protein n=1 Tax=Achromobacter spanius TaxID=217203 RepID=UPI00320A9AB6
MQFIASKVLLELIAKFCYFHAMEKPLDLKVRDLLLAHRGRWAEIAIATGVSHSWISKFVNGHIPNPGYSRLQRMTEHLDVRVPAKSGKPRNVSSSDELLPMEGPDHA